MQNIEINEKINNNNLRNKFNNKIINNNNKKYIINKIVENINKNKIISVSGVNGKIKAILILLIIKKINKNKRILIIDMDFLNNYLKKLLYGKDNIYYLDGRKLISKPYKVENYIDRIEKQFDAIIINTSHESFFDYNKKLVEKSNTNYFLIKNEENEFNKSLFLYNIYINNWKIKEDKIDIYLKK